MYFTLLLMANTLFNFDYQNKKHEPVGPKF